MKENKSGIVIIRSPNPQSEDASSKAITNLIEITSDNFDDVYLFENEFEDTPGKVVCNIENRSSKNPLLTIIYHLIFQLQLCRSIYRLKHSLDMIIWHSGGFTMVLPHMLAKIIRIQTVVCVLGRTREGYTNKSYWGYRAYIYAPLIGISESISYFISDKILIFSDDIIDYHTLSYFNSKIVKCRFNYEKIPPKNTPMEDRDITAVYVGRINEFKGAHIAAKAADSFQDMDNNMRFVFIGDGDLKTDLESEFSSLEYTGWIDHNSVLHYLQNSKFFILPSISEGLPKALTEAMACGTVPITTPVGNIPDTVVHGSNGFLLEKRNADVIIDCIDSVDCDELSTMSEEAVETIKRDHSYTTIKKEFEQKVL